MPAKSIRAIILENELAPKPLKPRDLAIVHGIKQSSIHRCRVRLRHEGLLKPSYHMKAAAERIKAVPQGKRFTPVAAELKEQAANWEQKDLDEVLTSPVMSEKERLEKLSLMARFGPDAISIAAIKALEELGRAKGGGVGPPKPLTEEEAITRLARLCSALGRETSERAFAVAFPASLEANVEAKEESLGYVPMDTNTEGSIQDVQAGAIQEEP